ncbi:MAG TPA: hypothetical protein VM345_05605 [Acidimicrobiales bacterium]|nr:hypothetical protein [Acidimicrobiales bacterium]
MGGPDQNHLLAVNAIAPAAEGSRELARQARQLDGLLTRVPTSPEAAYLSKYDALMRVVEIWLLRHGFRFGRHPHAGLKRLLTSFGCEHELVLRVVTVRHDIKKNGATVRDSDRARLDELLQRARATLMEEQPC